MDELRPKQKRFVQEYIDNGGNATQAIIDAGYDVNSNGVARSMGSENLTKPNIVKVLADAIPNELVTEKHKALLNKTNAEGEIDVQAVSKGVEMAYKIKGSFTDGGEKPIVIMPVLVQFLNNDETNSNPNTNRV